MTVEENLYYGYVPLLRAAAESKEYFRDWKENFSRSEIERTFEKVQNKLGILPEDFPNELLYEALKPLIEKVATLYKRKDVNNLDFCTQVFQVLESFQEHFKNIDFLSLSKEELYNLGFGNWKDELLLVPLYLLPIIPIGTELVCISGEKKIVGTDYINNDTRFGCIAYGYDATKIKENR